MKFLNIFYWLMFIIIILGYGTISYDNIIQHERIHQEINNAYDINSEITINNPIKILFTEIGGYTSADAKEYNEKCNETCKLAHNQNEILGYNISTIINLVFFSLTFLFICVYTIIIIIYKKKDL